MVVVTCSVPGCAFHTDDVSEALAIALLTNHGLAHSTTSPAITPPSPSATETFLRSWNVRHRISSVSFPQSNGRAEVAVKMAKRLLMSNTGPTGNLNHDGFLKAILQLRSTPDPDCNLSPEQIIFGRPLRDSFSFINRLEKFSNPHIRPLWRQAWTAKEDALRTRISRTTEALQTHSRPLRPLTTGDRVFLQNQQGHNATKWDRSGLVVDSLGNDQYRVKVDGSGRLTLRNRRFLRAYTPVSPANTSLQLKAPLPQYSHPQQTPQSRNTDTALPQEVIQPVTTVAQHPIPDITPTPTMVEPSVNHESLNEPLPPDVVLPIPTTTPAQDPPLSPRRLQHRRSQRVHRAPIHFEPETGTWQER